ncbi:ergot alkaloid biosynthesis protein [Microvirga pakistanensis]|uniref:ergot alkaloid biosynthesis protein n=1 Tax=Microvirga pakistanensis TaxID=1682650 RepID=UPI00106B0492|nr:ergot alkaloid biosynthesis protein [Microvirga pakistanensis]
MSNPSILLTGGTGKTGRRIAAQLAGKGLSARIASPTGAGTAGHQGVRFNWLNESTRAAALAGISAVYLLAPAGVAEPLPAMQPFLDQALNAGVHRFVLLSASSLEEDGPMMGKVHAHLKWNAPEWAVLRPTWFMQNFSEQQHLPTIQDEGRIYSATGDGRVPFIDADDIAAVAVAALTSGTAFNRDIITGPQALSYDEAAAIIGQAIGRRVEHVRLSGAELARRHQALGLNEAYAKTLAAMDTAIAHGAEDRVTDEVQAVTG